MSYAQLEDCFKVNALARKEKTMTMHCILPQDALWHNRSMNDIRRHDYYELIKNAVCDLCSREGEIFILNGRRSVGLDGQRHDPAAIALLQHGCSYEQGN